MQKFLLDANVFMEPARRYYAFDLVATYWTNLVRLARDDKVLSIRHVREEIDKGEDQLKEWARDAFRSYFDEPDEGVTGRYAQVVAWLDRQDQYKPEAKSEFRGGADGWLVATALAKDCVVVTHETTVSPNAKARVPIPNVCAALGVPYTGLFEMLRTLKVQLA